MNLSECNIGDIVGFNSLEHHNHPVIGTVVLFGNKYYSNRILLGFDNADVGWALRDSHESDIKIALASAGANWGWWFQKETKISWCKQLAPLPNGWYRCKCGATTSNNNKLCCGCK